MAPRFKQNMYQVYAKDIGADALICFPFSNDKFTFPFRDKLTEEISSTTNLYLDKNEGKPTKHDSCFRFFNLENEMLVKEFCYKEHPGLWAWILKTKKWDEWKEYRKEEQKVRQLVQIEISTSHDHTCIELYSSIHSEDSLSRLIETIANELNIDMVKNPKLPSMADIIMTNRTFDIKS